MFLPESRLRELEEFVSTNERNLLADLALLSDQLERLRQHEASARVRLQNLARRLQRELDSLRASQLQEESANLVRRLDHLRASPREKP